MKYLENKSTFIFHASSHRRAKYCVIGRNNVTLITFLFLAVDLFIMCYFFTKFTKNTKTVKSLSIWLFHTQFLFRKVF